jgi:hypothetical protein
LRAAGSLQAVEAAWTELGLWSLAGTGTQKVAGRRVCEKGLGG